MWTVKTLLSDDWRPRLIKTSLGLNATYEIPIKIVIVIKPVIFSRPNYLPSWSYAPYKGSDCNFESKIGQNLLKQTWSADRG